MAASFPDSYRPLLVQRLLLSASGADGGPRLTTRSTLARSLRNIFGASTQPDDELIDAAWTLITDNNGLAVVPRVIRYMAERKVMSDRFVGALQRATIPLKLIDGGADPISGRHMADRYRQLIPRPDVTILEGIGHYPQCEAPEEVFSTLAAWTAGAGANGSSRQRTGAWGQAPGYRDARMASVSCRSRPPSVRRP